MSTNDGPYVICFRMPETGVEFFAGFARDGALGYAPTVASAAAFDTREIAERVVLTSYGKEMREFAYVVSRNTVTA